MKSKTPSVPRFDTERNRVTGNALHIHPSGERGELYVGLSYPVSFGGKTTDRELAVMLSPEDRARLIAYLAEVSDG